MTNLFFRRNKSRPNTEHPAYARWRTAGPVVAAAGAARGGRAECLATSGQRSDPQHGTYDRLFRLLALFHLRLFSNRLTYATHERTKQPD